MDETATNFMLRAVQDWGQSESDRTSAVQDVLNAAGFNAIATCGPVFGGIWHKPCEGPDGPAATEWLKNLTDTMRRGQVQDEIAHVKKFITERKAA